MARAKAVGSGLVKRWPQVVVPALLVHPAPGISGRVLTEVTTDRGKERRLAYLSQEFGFTVERRIDLPAPLSRSYANLSLPGR